MNEEKAPYHHGDLRAALIRAAEAELSDTGVEGFSLRSVAKRVGVSHSAPAHHFGDVQGLLMALAAEGFRRFRAAMLARQQAAPDDPRDRLVASGHGYLDFAEASPALFRLMFTSNRVKEPSSELAEASDAAFQHLVDDVARLRGVSPYEDESAMADVVACWSMVHGFSELYLSGRLAPVEDMPNPEREALLTRLLLPILA
jgi:AcrR family transcriptional regulator